MKLILSLIIMIPIYAVSQLKVGVGLSFIPVISTETVMNYYSSTGTSSAILAVDPSYQLQSIFQLRSNLAVTGLYHLTLMEKGKFSYGLDITASGGGHLPWTEPADEIALMFSVGAFVFIENENDYNLIVGYKMSSGGLYMQHSIVGFSAPSTQFYLSSFRFKHYRQLSNGDIVTSKRIWEVGVKYFIFDNVGKFK